MFSRSEEVGTDYEDNSDQMKKGDLEHCEKEEVMSDEGCETLSRQWCDKLACPNGVDGNCLFKNNVEGKGCCIRKICGTSPPGNDERFFFF